MRRATIAAAGDLRPGGNPFAATASAPPFPERPPIMQRPRAALFALSLAVPTLALPAPLVAQAPAAAAAPTDMERLVKALDAFAVSMHGQLGDTETFSPASISLALLMVLPGARGETAAELERLLALPEDLRGERLHTAVRDLVCLLRGTTDGEAATELRVTNDVWLQDGFALVPEYVTSLQHQFSAEAHAVDFEGEREKARATINRAIATATNERIRELVPADVIDADTRLVLTNATWLRGSWLHGFREAATKPMPFMRADGTKVEVPTMHVVEHFDHAEDERMQVVRLPFADGDVVCDLVLPRGTTSLADAERAMLDGGYAARFASESVRVALPKFTVAGKVRLREALERLGLKQAFDGERADFSGMRKEKDLCVAEVVHETWIAVDEKGAEATAATAVVMKRAGAERPRDPKVFAADRPFAFVLRHRSGLVLFAGRVMDPSKS